MRVRDYIIQEHLFNIALKYPQSFILGLRSFKQSSFYHNRQNPPPGSGNTGVRHPVVAQRYGNNEINTLNQLDRSIEDFVLIYYSNIREIELREMLSHSLFLLHNKNSNWFSNVELLADKASAIIFLPECSDGVIEEANAFKTKHKHKIFFFAPRAVEDSKKNQLLIDGIPFVIIGLTWIFISRRTGGLKELYSFGY